MATLTEENIQERMKAIQVPTLILFGEFDYVVPPGNADLMLKKIPGAIKNILPGVGHIFPIEDPEATVEAIHAFLSSHSS